MPVHCRVKPMPLSKLHVAAVPHWPGCGVVRLLRNLLENREQAEVLGRRVAANAMAQDLKSTITSLLLESDLMLRERSVPPVITDRIRQVRDLADSLRVRLDERTTLLMNG